MLVTHTQKSAPETQKIKRKQSIMQQINQKEHKRERNKGIVKQ